MLVVEQTGLDSRGARTHNLDRCIWDTHGLGLLRGHHDNSGGTVALLLKAGNAQVLRDTRVVHALEILVGGIEPSCLRVLLDRGLVPGKGIQDGTAAKALGKAVQGVIDLIGGKVVLHRILVDPVVERHAKGAIERATISAVIDLIERGNHNVERKVLTNMGGHMLNGKRRSQIAGTRKDNIVGTGGDCHHGLLKGDVARAASLGMMDRALGTNAKPIGNLHVWGNAIANEIRIGAAVIEKVDIAGLKTGIGNCLESRIAKRLALANTLGLGMLLKILERGAAYAYNRDAAHVLSERNH